MEVLSREIGDSRERTQMRARRRTNCSRRPQRFAPPTNWSINDDSLRLDRVPARPRRVAQDLLRSTRTHTAKRMFGFLTSGTKEIADPLVSAKAVAQLAAPAAGARRHRPPAAGDARVRRDAPVAQAGRPRRACRRSSSSTPRSAPTAASSPSNTSRTTTAAPKLAERIWQSIYDLSQGFIYAYQTALEEALRAGRQRALEAAACRCCSRGSRITTAPTPSCACSATSAGFPASGWSCTARTCARRSSASIACRRCSAAPGPTRRSGRSSRNTSTSLLIHQLNTGNMSPPQLDWAIVAAARVEPAPAARRGAALARRLLRRHRRQDRASCRRTGNDSGSMLRYLDTTPLAEQLDRAIARAAPGRGHRPGPGGADQPAAHRDPREGAPVGGAQPQCRTAPRSAHRVRGDRARCASACRASARSSRSEDTRHRRRRRPAHGSEQIEVFAVADGSRAQAPRAATSTIRSPRACRRSPTRCGRSRTAASPACASRRRAASARAWRWARSSPCGSRTSPTGCWASCAG